MATKINYTQIQAEADLYKYSIVPSISSGNLTVALKNYLGQDQSVTTPVKGQIGSEVRTITGPLNITVNAGSNYFNAGSSELATKEIDYFTYLWVNNLGNMQIGISRIPNGLTYSDFSTNGSNEKFLTDFIGNTAGTNKVINIGRFSAILSSGAGYTWSTPSAGFQVINHYINKSKKLYINGAITGFSSISNQTYSYWIDGDIVTIGGTNSIGGTSNATTFTMELPFDTTGTRDNFGFIAVQDNSSNQSTPGHIRTTGTTSTVNIFTNFYAGSWTNTGGKSFFLNTISYSLT